jgi:outer membrane murein-binding lipoprotein Lpp
MQFTTITAVVVLTLALAGCAKEENKEGVIPEGYKSAVEKAKGVEDTLNDAMQKQAEEIEN